MRGLMAKKMLSLHATFKRAVPSWRAGMVTLAEPEFGLPLAREVQFAPSSRVMKRSTLLQLMGAALVPATSQLMVCVLPAPRGVTTGLVRAKALPVLTTWIFMSSLATPPLPSRAVRRKFRSRLVAGQASPIARVLVSREVRLGRVRSGTLVGATKRNSGRLPSSTMVGGLGASVPTSICSQV